MAETVSFKVCLKNSGEKSDSDVRRFAVDRSLSMNFAALSEKLSTIFPCLNNKTFAVTWIDEENDTITISTDDELTIAISEMSGPVYKLNVQVTGEEKAAAGRDTDGDVHPGVMCDGCEKDLVGFRYKCLACPDFDLCGVCESAGLHPEHRMIRISKPGQKFSPKFGQNVRGNQRNSSQRPCHVPMPGHMAGNQWNSSQRPCHVPMPGHMAGNQRNSSQRPCHVPMPGHMAGNQRISSQRPCHIPMPGHMAGNQRNSSQSPCHVPMPGFMGFLQGLEKVAGGHGNFGNCSKEEKPCNETNVGEKDAKNATENEEKETNHGEEVRKENEDKKGNSEKSPTEKMVTTFLEAAAGYLGDDIQVPSKDIENVGKLVSDIVSMFNVEVDTDEQSKEPKDKSKEQEVPSEPRNVVKPEKQKSTNSNDDEEEWTIVKDDSHNQVPPSNIYPTLDEVAISTSSDTEASVSSAPHSSSAASNCPYTTLHTTTNTSPPSSVSGATPSSPDTTSVSATTPCLPSAPTATNPCLPSAPASTNPCLPSATTATTPCLPSAPAATTTCLPSASAATTPCLPSAPTATNPCLPTAPAATTPCLPSAPADVADPKILVALQAMTNMGFTNEGGWLQNLLEAKEGDIGKVLDVIKPNNK